MTLPQMPEPDFDVAIAGAGPVGTTLAWLLARQGFRIALFESEAGPIDQLRASTFHPPTLDMLDDDGITDELIAAGRITPTWQVRMHDTGERAEFDLAVLDGDTKHPYRLQCRQEVLVRSCLKRLCIIQPKAVHFQYQVASVVNEPDRTRLNVVDAGGKSSSVTATWTVGCDGAHSVIRGSMNIPFEGDAYPESTILATTRFSFEDHLPNLSGVNYVWKSDTTFSLLRLPQLWRCSFHPLPGQSDEQALSDTSLAQHLTGVVDNAAEVPVEQRRIYRVHHRVAKTYRSQRVFLAGDSAHLNSPKGGMGMNGGIHDAFELASVLVTAGKDANAPALDRYERRRRPIAVNDIIGQADQNRARMQITDRAARLKRLSELQAIAANKDSARQFLLRSSMIEGLRKSRQIS